MTEAMIAAAMSIFWNDTKPPNTFHSSEPFGR